jgi:hypothetical protein
MANLQAIQSVGNSLLTYLRSEYEQLRSHAPPAYEVPDCQFSLLSGNELDSIDNATRTLSLFLYRVIMNEHLRSSTRTNRASPSVPLSVDLHYLMTMWAPNAVQEQFIFAWAVRQLHLHPVFDASTLMDAGWAPDEVVHVVPAELSNEDLMRIWDALQPTYHLSKAYIARAVRIDPDQPVGGDRPVVATRFLAGNRQSVQAAVEGGG